MPDARWGVVAVTRHLCVGADEACIASTAFYVVREMRLPGQAWNMPVGVRAKRPVGSGCANGRSAAGESLPHPPWAGAEQ